jgi:hypothetical protein
MSLLALYGLSAFALGAWQTTAYQALFAGRSIWRALPRWFQGGLAGGLVALPLALLDSRAAQTLVDQRAFADAGMLIKRFADAPAPSTFNVVKTADEIGNDPAALFAYVHDHVRTEIYRGVLRGPRATLMGRAGNSWDQAPVARRNAAPTGTRSSIRARAPHA